MNKSRVEGLRVASGSISFTGFMSFLFLSILSNTTTRASSPESQLAVAQLPVTRGAIARSSTERVVFHTQVGDLVFALFPDSAPKTVAQFLKLVKAGVYNSTHFYRIEPGFILQTANAEDRLIPLTPVQKALIENIPDEFSTSLHHVPGVLSMAHGDTPNSGQTSFSILLGNAPHLDGKYTVFGKLIFGQRTLANLISVPRDAENLPKVNLQIQHAFGVDSGTNLLSLGLVDGAPMPPEMLAAISAAMTLPVLWSGPLGPCLLLGIFGLALFFLSSRIDPRSIASLGLLAVLVAGFLIFVNAVPIAQHNRILGGALALGWIGIFRLMGHFESPRNLE